MFYALRKRNSYYNISNTVYVHAPFVALLDQNVLKKDIKVVHNRAGCFQRNVIDFIYYLLVSSSLSLIHLVINKLIYYGTDEQWTVQSGPFDVRSPASAVSIATDRGI
jgi:hypothetical protein